MGINTLGETLRYFIVIFIELVVLFIGISFLVGLLKGYISNSYVKRFLDERPGQGNFLGALLGSLTPFCSCSTIPIIVGLLNSGAPFGSAISFLVASPLLNPVILSLFLAMMGWKVTLLYAITCFTLSVMSGFLWERLGMQKYVKHVKISGGEDQSSEHSSFRSRASQAFKEALVLFYDALSYLIIGVAIGSFIYGFIPTEWIANVAGPQRTLAIPVAAIIGIPLYIRVETMVPISVSLLNKGMGIGAVMALIIGGAGASIPEVSLLASIFKPRLVAVFVVTILTVAILSGYIFNMVL